MKAQEYYIEMNEEHRENAAPAQFVFGGNDSDVIVGFISEVNYDTNRLRFTLFESRDSLDYMIDVVEELSDEVLIQRLNEALDANPEMIAEWQDLHENGISTEL